MTVDFHVTVRHARCFGVLVLSLIIYFGGAFGRALAAQEVELTWSPSPNAGIAHYEVCFGTASLSYTFTNTFDAVTNVIIRGLRGGQTNYFAVLAVDTNGVESPFSNEATYTAPVSAPLVLQAQGISPTSQAVALSWSPSLESDVNAYVVYYGTQSGDYTDSATFYNETNAIISGLDGGTTYYFAVVPVDSYGVETNLSNEVSFTVPFPPQLWLQAQAVAPGAQEVQLDWTPSSNSYVYGYMIYYGTQSGSYDNLTSVFGTTSATIYDLIGGTNYYFAVAPIDYAGVESILSNEASFAVPARVPLSFQARGSPSGWQDAALTWSPSPNTDVYGYQVYFGTQSGVYDYVEDFYYATNGIISGLNPGTTYYFAVAPIDYAGVESLLSNEASFAVPASQPIVLQTQTFTDGNGQPYQMQINTFSVVSGYWKLECSTDLRNWQYYTNGIGPGNGDGNDVNVTVPIDPAKPRIFFRLMNLAVYVPLPVVLQTQTITNGIGQPPQMQINTFSVVSGYWQMESSTDLQNWQFLTAGTGAGNGDGNDVNVTVPMDPTEPQVFFRVITY